MNRLKNFPLCRMENDGRLIGRGGDMASGEAGNRQGVARNYLFVFQMRLFS